MEAGCHSLHRLKHRAVITLIIVFSLFFYIISIHIHYYQRILEVVGILKNVDFEIQQIALYDLFTGSVDEEDGKYVLMKNGYQFTGRYYLFFDLFSIIISFIYIIFLIYLFNSYKKRINESTVKIEKELDYLKEQMEYFLFNTKFIRNDSYKECNYLLDRLEQISNDMEQKNKKESNKMINFHQNIIHQINTPLNTIKILVEFLYDEGKVNKSYLDSMNYAIEKASDLARIYLRTSKLDTGKVRYHFENIDLFEMIEEVFHSLKIYADYYEIDLINKCDNTIIYVDIVWMKEAIENIVKNIIEHVGNEKRIEIHSETIYDLTIIYIDDNGISSFSIDDINFERFQSSQSGIGIGLHLCKQIIDAHLGEIKVEKFSLGGSRFIIKLPKQPCKKKFNPEEKYENNSKS